ncbi:MAG: SAM-dependent methyltransferase, partial [Desulfococcaceae bacterium]
MNTQTGTLYGIGVGPGDPELLPLKAVRLLGEVDVVFAASSTKNSYSLAMDIAGPHIP